MKKGRPLPGCPLEFDVCNYLQVIRRLHQFPRVISRHDRLDTLHRVQQIADGSIVVERVDNVGDILAHIAVDIPLSAEQLRCLVDQVRGEYTADGAVLVSLVEPIQPGSEKPKGGENKNLSRLALF